MSIRAVERMTGIHRDTIMRLPRRVFCTLSMDKTARSQAAFELQTPSVSDSPESAAKPCRRLAKFVAICALLVMWPFLTRKIFGPASVPEKFEHGFPKEMTFRPSQIRASAAESALMIPVALAGSGHYAKLKMPIVILAGEEDRLIDIDKQSARLHSELPNSSFHRVPGVGHMVHQTAPIAAMAAINAAALSNTAPLAA